nr:M24 family metallopeptidase [Desulfobacterales bacterium]
MEGGYSLHARVIVSSGPNLGIVPGAGAATITWTGLNSALPMGACSRRICQGDMVMVDIGTSIEGYHSDEARMYGIGKPDGGKKRCLMYF